MGGEGGRAREGGGSGLERWVGRRELGMRYTHTDSKQCTHTEKG